MAREYNTTFRIEYQQYVCENSENPDFFFAVIKNRL